MRKLLFLLALPLSAVTNQMTIKLPCNPLATDSVITTEFLQVGQRWCDSSAANDIKEWNGSAWVSTGGTAGTVTNYPLQFARPFVDGEIANYPQVLQDGVALTTQAVVKQRWGSGNVKHAIISVILPTLTVSGSILTFQDQATGNTTAPTRTDLLNEFTDFDATITYTPDSSNCPGCTAKTASARTMLAALPVVIPACTSTQIAPCLWTQGAVATTVLLADHTTKAYDIGWKQTNSTTWPAIAVTITNVSGKAAFTPTSITCATNICTIAATAHKMAVGDLVTVVSSGVTGLDGTGRRVATVADANTFTITQSMDVSTLATQQKLTNLTLSGSSSGVGTITPTRITVTFSSPPSSINDHPFWPGDSVAFASVGGSGITTGNKPVVRTPSASTFQINYTPTGAYTSGGTATLTVLAGERPRVPVTTGASLTAPLWIRSERVGSYSRATHVCSIVSNFFSTYEMLVTGNDACEEFTITQSSLTDSETSVTVTNASTIMKIPNAAQGGVGYGTYRDFAFARDRVYALVDGTNPIELVQLASISGNTVNFLQSGGTRTYIGGTRSAHSGTIKLVSIGRGEFFSTSSSPANFESDITIATQPNVHPSTYVETSGTAENVYKTVRPMFEVTFWHGQGIYQVRAISEIADSQRFGDQFYSTAISVGDASPVARYPVLPYERSTIWPHPAGSRWSRRMWGPGSHPPLANIDYNITYLRDTPHTYYYDTDKMLSTAGRDGEILDYTAMNAAYKDILGTAYYQPYMGNTGGRPELGPYTRASTRAIMCGALDDCWKVWYIAERHSEQLATFSAHFREGSPDPALVATDPTNVGAQTRYYGRHGCTVVGNACDSLDTALVSGLGRHISIRSHPKLDLKAVNAGEQNSFVGAANTADQIPTRGAKHSSIQAMDTAHTYDHNTPLYLLRGDYWFLEQALFSVGFDNGEESRNPRGPDDGSYACCGYGQGEPRGAGRRLNKMANLYIVLPDSTPEQTLLSQQVKEWIVAETDSREMTSSYSADNGLVSLAAWAATTRAQAMQKRADGTYQGPSPLGQWMPDDPGRNTVTSDPDLNVAMLYQYTTIWEHNILGYSIGRAEEVGFTGARQIKEFLGKLSINLLTTSGINKYIAAIYRFPSTTDGFADDAAITAVLNDATNSAHCLATGTTTSDFKKNGVLLARGEWHQTLKGLQCGTSNTAPLKTNGTATYYDGGYKANAWHYAATPGPGCSADASYALYLNAAMSYLRGMPNWDTAWNTTYTEILNGTCANTWRSNPSFSFDARPSAAVPPQVLAVTPNIWAPTCVAGQSAPVTTTFAVSVSPTPELSYSVSDNQSWLTFTSGATGTTPGTLLASVDCSGLSASTPTGTVTASASGAVNGTATVNLTVTAPVTATATVELSKAGPTDIIFILRRSEPTDPCTLTLSGISPVAIGGELAVARGIVRGLTASTTYPYTLSCTSGASSSGNLSTIAAPAAGSPGIPVDLWPPAYLGAATATLHYGSTTSLGSTSSATACSSGCTITLPGARGAVVFYKVVWDTGAETTVRPVIIP